MRRSRAMALALQISKQLQAVSLCPVCEKPAIVLSEVAAGTGRWRHVPSVVSAETHCACPPTADHGAGPAYVAPGKTDADFMLGYGFLFTNQSRRR